MLITNGCYWHDIFVSGVERFLVLNFSDRKSLRKFAV